MSESYLTPSHVMVINFVIEYFNKRGVNLEDVVPYYDADVIKFVADRISVIYSYCSVGDDEDDL